GAGWLTIRDFDAAQKQNFYTKLYAIKPNGGTPLRIQMNRIGQLYQSTLADFDYAGNDPYRESAASSKLTSCRPSYHIMSTDGFWNESLPSGFPSAVGTSLASIADYYYKTDLRDALDNNIKPTNTRDTATWQHMTTFTIGLGADGTIPYSETEPTTWPTPVADSPSAIDDLWHAAVVGKGRYFSAKNPTALQAGLTSVLKDIAVQTGAASTGAITGSAIDGDSYFYVPSFESGRWIGHLKAYNLTSAGSVGTVQWDAATKLPASDARNIVTWNPASGAAVDFLWDNLTTGSGSQQSLLASADVLEYLRGNAAKEQTELGAGPGIYRYRANKLGDIVNSAPLYVKKTDFGYQVLPEASGGGATYRAFVSGKASRTPMLYVGANDGMLHGFNATSGVESFAYVPNALYSKLVSLSSPDYGHNYYVDGLLTEGDAYLGGAWKTILLGSIGAGGSGVFAIDISNPGSLTAGKVLWEKGAGDLADMGRVMGQLTAVRLRNGQWGAVFGNGYDSASGKAVLYVINLSTGALIKSFELTTGSVNGLSAPALLFNAQRELVGAYAGDLLGNLWKFNFDDTSTAGWSSSKLFSAVNDDGKIQPMVKRPALAQHPSGGYLVTVATGK
ncbi:MAG TPA: PilC/PilY family type IV pilus protein, partial [Burkholderiaceae bacterium]|nr:PilC/PilY family type IV pilus protein [Burkholderiaceae bacterium]